MVCVQFTQQLKVQRTPVPQTLRQWHYSDTAAGGIIPALWKALS